MRSSKTLLGLSVLAVFAASGVVTTASAVAISDGSYTITINPSVDLIPGNYITNVGTDGNWNTSFGYDYPVTGESFGMWDSPDKYDGGVLPVVVGDHVLDPSNYGNGNSGEIGISVSQGAINFTSYQVDCIGYTIAGTWCQAMTNLGGASGFTNSSETVLDLSTRFANIGIIPGFPVNLSFPGLFTTGNTIHSTIGSMNGTPVSNIGDVNGDGLDDYTATFVSINILSAEWSDFANIPYVEVWNTQILSSPVPVPAAVWLFGSGLLGLVSLARRK